MDFKVLTCNIACLPQWISSGINGLRPLLERVDELCNVVLEHYADFDVLCFQEAFDLTAEARITARLNTDFPYISSHNGDHLLGVNSGLMILSKYPFKHKYFHAYPRRSGVGVFSKKGVLLVNFEKGNRSITACTTHLQAGGSFTKYWDWLWGNPDTITEWQLDYLNSKLWDFNKIAQADVTIFCGDLNADIDRELNMIDHVSHGFEDQKPVNFPHPYAGTCLKEQCIKSEQWVHPTPANECKNERIDAMYIRSEQKFDAEGNELPKVGFRGASEVNPRFGNATDHCSVVWEGQID